MWVSMTTWWTAEEKRRLDGSGGDASHDSEVVARGLGAAAGAGAGTDAQAGAPDVGEEVHIFPSTQTGGEVERSGVETVSGDRGLGAKPSTKPAPAPTPTSVAAATATAAVVVVMVGVATGAKGAAAGAD